MPVPGTVPHIIVAQFFIRPLRPSYQENFEDFVWTLQTALSQDDVVWVCSFALNQNADIEQAISGELIDCPFAVALRHAVKQLVVLDEHLVVPRRPPALRDPLHSDTSRR